MGCGSSVPSPRQQQQQPNGTGAAANGNGNCVKPSLDRPVRENNIPVLPLKTAVAAANDHRGGNYLTVTSFSGLTMTPPKGGAEARRTSRAQDMLLELSKLRLLEEEQTIQSEQTRSLMGEILSEPNARPGARGKTLKSPRPPMSARRLSGVGSPTNLNLAANADVVDGGVVFGEICARMDAGGMDEPMMITRFDLPLSPILASGDLGAFSLNAPRGNGSPDPGVRRSSLGQVRHRPRDDVIRSYEFRTLLGHASRVKCMAVSPSERHYVSCCHDETAATMYDIFTGRDVVTFFGHEDTIIGAAFSRDGRTLATTSRDNSMILWDAVTGRRLFIFDHDKVVICCAFSHDSRHLVSGCQDMVCRVWDIKKRKEVVAFTEHEGIIVCITWAPGDNLIVSGAADQTVRIWSSKSGVAVQKLTGHTGIVLSCEVSSSGDHIVSNDEKVIKVWELHSGRCVNTMDVMKYPSLLQGSGRGATTTRSGCKKLAWTLAAYCPSRFGFYILGVNNDRMVYVFDPFTGKEVLAFCCKFPVYCLATGPRSTVCLGDSCGNVYVVELR
eukprot:RCo042057